MLLCENFAFSGLQKIHGYGALGINTTPSPQDFDVKIKKINTMWPETLFLSSITVAAKSVCYSGLGCFDDSLRCNSRPLPQSPSDINTKFYLFTPENPDSYQVIDWTNDASIVNSNFRDSRGTKFIIHGFTDRILTQDFLDMKDGFLSIVSHLKIGYFCAIGTLPGMGFGLLNGEEKSVDKWLKCPGRQYLHDREPISLTRGGGNPKPRQGR